MSVSQSAGIAAHFRRSFPHLFPTSFQASTQFFILKFLF